MKTGKPRSYEPAEAAVFLKTNERFGELSNMAPRFPVTVNGVKILTVEALYQACRFPHDPEIQQMIIAERSPMSAKMRSKPFRDRTRHDWDRVRINLMRWCLRVKLNQNPDTFSSVLLSTGDMQIVEKKVRRADFWGAQEQPDGTLVGLNVLGRLLMELRDKLKEDGLGAFEMVEPLPIADFLLFGEQIGPVERKIESYRKSDLLPTYTQASLF